MTPPASSSSPGDAHERQPLITPATIGLTELGAQPIPPDTSTDELRHNIWRNTLSNYVCMGLRLILGLIMFRLLFQKLSREEFGFWSLLWSVFGYGILLDFGFGFTAQKRVAELSARGEWDRLSRVLSTIFFTYVAIGAAIVVLGLAASPFLVELFRVTPENRAEFQEILMLFFCGLGLAFPLGLFPEILRGLQRISMANSILLSGMIVNFALAAVALYFGCSLKTLFLIAIICTYVPDLICGVLATRFLPTVEIRVRFFSVGMIRETMQFSVFAYVTMVSNLILAKTDQLVISTALAVSAVAVYQAGAKVAELFSGLAQQLPDTLSPAAAHLHAKGNREVLRELLISGTRFTVMFATPLYLICMFFMDGILRLLTGEPSPNRETFWIAQVLLLWIYISVVTQSVPKRIFMMSGHERRLTWISAGEALLNFALSLGLVLYFKNVVCVALGSLVATLVFGGAFLWPWAAREAGLTGAALARVVLLPTWIACLPLLVLIGCERFVPALDFADSVVVLMIESALAVAVAAAGVWRFALNDFERTRFIANMTRMFARRRPA